ncbi:MAG: S41 family peptidase [Lachnospiraceae bacterium]
MDEEKMPIDLEENDNEVKKERTYRRPKMNGYSRGIICGISVTLILCILIGLTASVVLEKNGYTISKAYVTDRETTNDVLSTEAQNKMAELINIMNTYYYDKLDSKKMLEGVYTGLVESLGDPYSTYFTAEKYKAYNESATGKYYGIGAVLQQDVKTKQVKIIRAYPGTPAEKAGLEAGDIIIEVEGIDASSRDLTELVTHIKGEKGTKVHMVIERAGKEKYLNFDIDREKIEVPTVEAQMLQDKTGYIAISEFGEVTAQQFETAVADLQKQGVKALIIDLRDNPGGMLTSVAQILDDILPKGILVYTEDKNGKREEYKSTDKTQLKLPMTVLVNENSASAAEIFAGAIRDYEYGTLIGTTTFGKGIVQVLLPMDDGSAIKVTTAKYYTPKGDYIHGVGIAPDIKLEFQYQGDKDKTYDIMKDNQVLKALEVLKKGK